MHASFQTFRLRGQTICGHNFQRLTEITASRILLSFRFAHNHTKVTTLIVDITIVRAKVASAYFLLTKARHSLWQLERTPLGRRFEQVGAVDFHLANSTLSSMAPQLFQYIESMSLAKHVSFPDRGAL